MFISINDFNFRVLKGLVDDDGDKVFNSELVNKLKGMVVQAKHNDLFTPPVNLKDFTSLSLDKNTNKCSVVYGFNFCGAVERIQRRLYSILYNVLGEKNLYFDSPYSVGSHVSLVYEQELKTKNHSLGDRENPQVVDSGTLGGFIIKIEIENLSIPILKLDEEQKSVLKGLVVQADGVHGNLMERFFNNKDEPEKDSLSSTIKHYDGAFWVPKENILLAVKEAEARKSVNNITFILSKLEKIFSDKTIGGLYFSLSDVVEVVI